MGQLIFCSHPPAEKPYYIESASLHVYSLEEMSYYLIHNAELVEMDFVSEEFCEWVRIQIGEEALALELSACIEQGKAAYQFVRILLEETGYASEQEICRALDIFQQMEEKDELSQKKIRADRLLRRGKYSAAMEEYRWILKNRTEQSAEEFLGDVSHNLGTAYANMFLFSQAADSYHDAYARNMNPESQKEEMLCLMLAGEEEKQRIRAEEYGIGKLVKSCEEELEDAGAQALAHENVKKIRTLYESYERNPQEVIKSEIHEIVHTWRKEYENYGR